MIFYIIHSLMYLYTTIQFLKFFYPEKYEIMFNNVKVKLSNTAITLFFKGVYYYSKVELIILKCKINYNKLLNYFNINNINIIDLFKNYLFQDDFIYNDDDEYLNYVKDGKIINSCFTHLVYNKDITYDFIIYSKNNCDILYLKNPSDLTYELVNYKFVQIEINFENNKNTTLEIKLLNEKYNYYIVNNFIDSKFILYFLRNHYTKEVSQYTDEYLLNYTLNIIDHNINIIPLSNKSRIIFNKNEYIIEVLTENVDENINEVISEHINEQLQEEIDNKIVLNNHVDTVKEAENRKVTDLMFQHEKKDSPYFEKDTEFNFEYLMDVDDYEY